MIITAIVLAVLLWVWLFTTSPSERYWQCMDGEMRGWKEPGASSDFGDVAFILADENCDRPSDISRDEAEAEWLRGWEAP